MSEDSLIKYKYRRWPIFVPLYIVFAFIYFFSVYSFSELNFDHIAETLVMTVFVLSPLLVIFFDLKIVKVSEYKALALEIFYSWLISFLLIFVLMFAYIEGEAWFGAIALLFFHFIYNVIVYPISYFLFRIMKRKQQKINA